MQQAQYSTSEQREPRGRGAGWNEIVRRAVIALLVGVFSLGALTACGGDAGATKAAAETPTTVSADDLDREGEFWRSLTPDLKDVLVDLGKDRLAEERPDGAAQIQALSTGELVAEIDKQYTNQGKRDQSIYVTYTGANNRIAMGTFRDAMGKMDSLCSGPDAPPECDE